MSPLLMVCRHSCHLPRWTRGTTLAFTTPWQQLGARDLDQGKKQQKRMVGGRYATWIKKRLPLRSNDRGAQAQHVQYTEGQEIERDNAGKILSFLGAWDESSQKGREQTRRSRATRPAGRSDRIGRGSIPFLSFRHEPDRC